jgi:hypothetical protein
MPQDSLEGPRRTLQDQLKETIEFPPLTAVHNGSIVYRAAESGAERQVRRVAAQPYCQQSYWCCCCSQAGPHPRPAYGTGNGNAGSTLQSMAVASSSDQGQVEHSTGRLPVFSAVRGSATYLLAALIPALVFVPNLDSYFVADDWPLLARNLLAWQEGIGLFTTTRFGWYRPLFDLFLSASWTLFGLNPLGYHLCVLLLYILVAMAVGAVGELLTGRRAVGLLSALLFAALGAHAEPVLWIASANEVLAGLMVVLGVLAYLLFRRSSKPAWLVVAGLCYLLGLASKETALFMPLGLVALEWILFSPAWPRPRWRSLLPILPFVLVGAGFAIFRLRGGSPYPMSVSPGRVMLNLAYYLGIEFLALPDNYGYLTSLPIWRQVPWLPLLTVGLAVAGLAIAGRHVAKSGGPSSPQRRALLFSLVWSLALLPPVILTATGRTAFLSTMGVAWALSILFYAAWQRGSRRQGRRWAVVALVLVLSANLVVCGYRTYWWRQAGDTSQALMEQLGDRLAELPIGPLSTPVWLVGLPDHLHHAYVFRNAFPEAATLSLPGSTVDAILDPDSETRKTQPTAAEWIDRVPCSDCVIFLYQDGSLERLR